MWWQTYYMSWEDNVDAMLVQESFHLLPHALELLVVRGIAVVPGRVPRSNDPRGDSSIESLQILL
jgi:hypothetical protein